MLIIYLSILMCPFTYLEKIKSFLYVSFIGIAALLVSVVLIVGNFTYNLSLNNWKMENDINLF